MIKYSNLNLPKAGILATVLLSGIQTTTAQQVDLTAFKLKNVIVDDAVVISESNSVAAGTNPNKFLFGLIDDALPDKTSDIRFCSISAPGQVRRYDVTCPGARRLDVRIADGFIAGDHWEAKVKVWDEKPNTAVTTSPGQSNVLGASARVYKYAGTPFNQDLRALVECSYIHGINVFPAASFIRFNSDGNACAIVDLGVTSEIKRTP